MSVIVPGSYDPVTLGHLDVIRRACEKYGEVYAVIFVNPDKKYTFSVDDRIRMLMLATEDMPHVLVSYSDGRVVDYMREHGIERIVKGYRNEVDLEYERVQAEYNMKHGGYETELLECAEHLSAVSSTEARRRIEAGEPLSEVLPPSVIEYIEGHK